MFGDTTWTCEAFLGPSKSVFLLPAYHEDPDFVECIIVRIEGDEYYI